MCSMSHKNKQSLCQVYSDTDYADISTQGPVINFNLLYSSGNIIGYSQVSQSSLELFDVKAVFMEQRMFKKMARTAK